jgi:hypothetical protein
MQARHTVRHQGYTRTFGTGCLRPDDSARVMTTPPSASRLRAGDPRRRCAKDRGVGQGRSTRLSTRRVSESVQRQELLQPTNRLGIRVAPDEGKTTVVAGNPVAALWNTGREECRDLETRRFPYVPSHIHDDPDSEQRGREGRARVVATRQQPDHSRFICAGGDAREATGAEQGSKNGAEQEVRSCLIRGPRLDQEAQKRGRFSDSLFWIWTIMDHESFCRFLVSA